MNKGYLLILCAILFLGCKKETRTFDEWQALAEAKLNEIEALVATIPCAQQSEAVIESVAQYCGERYYPVTPSIKAKFNRLREQYEQFDSRRWAALIDEGGVIDCLDPTPQPIRLGCQDNKLLVYTTYNLPIEEARERVEDLHAVIQHYKDTISCAGNQQWGIEVVQNLESDELEAVPVRYDNDGSILQKWWRTFADYQVLVYRLWQDAGSETYPRLAKQPTGVRCVDGKPIVEYKEE